MKTKCEYVKIILTAFLILGPKIPEVISQFGVLATNYGRTTAPIGTIGIGAFPATTDFQARLHVNNFYCFNPTGSLNGKLFRTDGDQTVNNAWQFYTGTSATAQNERFRISIQPNGWDTCLCPSIT